MTPNQPDRAPVHLVPRLDLQPAGRQPPKLGHRPAKPVTFFEAVIELQAVSEPRCTRSGFPTTSRSPDPDGSRHGAPHFAVRPRRAPPGPRNPSTSTAPPAPGHDDLAGPGALGQPNDGDTQEAIDIKWSVRRGRNSAAEEFGYRVFGVGAGEMAGFGPRAGPPTVRDQYRLPRAEPRPAIQTRSVLRLADAGPFHPAVMAICTWPVKRPARRRSSESAAAVALSRLDPQLQVFSTVTLEAMRRPGNVKPAADHSVTPGHRDTAVTCRVCTWTSPRCPPADSFRCVDDRLGTPVANTMEPAESGATFRLRTGPTSLQQQCCELLEVIQRV